MTALEDPYSYDEEDANRSVAAGAGLAHEAARNFTNAADTRFATTSGARSGASQNAQHVAAAGLGTQLARLTAEETARAKLQRNQDLSTIFNSALAILGPLLQTRQNQVNAQLGQGGVYAQLAGVPGPVQGLGQFVGQTVTAAGAAGGFGPLVGLG